MRNTVDLLQELREQLEMIIQDKFDHFRSASEFFEAKYALDSQLDLSQRDHIVELLDDLEMYEDMRKIVLTLLSREEVAADDE